MSAAYDAAAIEILSGLEPVRKRPGMYTDTSRPNHLAQEVIDNSVEEAMAGHASRIDVTLYKDGSLEVRDDGRGMPIDIHPKEKIPGVEVILTAADRKLGTQLQAVVQLPVGLGFGKPLINTRDILAVEETAPV